MSEKRLGAATVHTKTAQAECIRGDKTQKRCQHASSVEANENSQNRVAMTEPQYHTWSGHI